MEIIFLSIGIIFVCLGFISFTKGRKMQGLGLILAVPVVHFSFVFWPDFSAIFIVWLWGFIIFSATLKGEKFGGYGHRQGLTMKNFRPMNARARRNL